jgi:hypothetical protein
MSSKEMKRKRQHIIKAEDKIKENKEYLLTE